MLVKPKTPNSIEVHLVNWIAGLVQSNIDLASVLARLRDSYRIALAGGRAADANDIMATVELAPRDAGKPTVVDREAREMSDKAYLIRFKHPALGIQSVIAAVAEIHGEHIALLNSKGKLAALFLTEVVDSWLELPILPLQMPGAFGGSSVTG